MLNRPCGERGTAAADRPHHRDRRRPDRYGRHRHRPGDRVGPTPPAARADPAGEAAAPPRRPAHRAGRRHPPRPVAGRAHTERFVRAVNTLDADLVAVVGDLVDGRVEDLGSAVTPLRDLRSRHGAYFVTGNHEYFSGHEAWIEQIGALGLRVLRVELVELDAFDGLILAGVNDATGGEVGDPPDYDRALGDRDP